MNDFAIPMTQLCALGLKHDTDKSPYWRGCTGHPYTPFYSRVLSGRLIRRILEIGVCTGASLRMWEEYFPEAQIYGIDIVPEVIAETKFDTKRVELEECDAGNAKALQGFVRKRCHLFDLIIDDGSHLVKDQIAAANFLRAHLATEGIYVIEDVQEGTADEIADGLKMPCKVIEPKSSVAPPRSDDRLIVMWRSR